MNFVYILDFLGNFRSTVLLVSFAPGFVSLPCIIGHILDF